MYKIAVIGEPWVVWGFAGLGLSVYPVDKDEEVKELLESINKDYAIIFVTETYEDIVQDKLKLDFKGDFPLLCLIPNNKERKRLGHEAIRELIRRAVGFEIG